MAVFSPFKYGSIEVSNRLVRSATGEGAAQENVGCPTAAMAAFYSGVASGGVGLIISGHVSVSYAGRCRNTMAAFYSDDFIPAFADIVDACHRQNTPIVCQLNHGGRQVNPEHEGIRAVCPSPVQAKGAEFIPDELTSDEIEEIIDDFGKVAGRAQNAGFDGVQIHSAHGYLITQFNSPLTNKRTDQWGGTPEKRRRFIRAVYESMRKHVGDDYPILVKQNVSDFHPEGLAETEAIEICRMLDGLGITAIELSGGIAETIMTAFKAKEIRKKGEAVFFDEQAKKIRDVVKCPLILTGGIRALATAEKLISDNICDGIGLCRPMIREPDLPRKWKNGDKTNADCTTCYRCTSNPERCNYCAAPSTVGPG